VRSWRSAVTISLGVMVSICPTSLGVRGSKESLLRASSAQASTDGFPLEIPISELPKLPKRGMEYYTEPWCGIFIVSSLSISLTFVTTAVGLRNPSSSVASVLGVGLIWTWALVAVVCTAYILFGRAGEIKRSPSTCYPIPQDVANALLANKTLELMDNVEGMDGASFCVRCLLWRPSKSHHCSTCQRCVTGFDHHCGVFGRCIVRGNMPCFVTLNLMMLAGLFTFGMVWNDPANWQPEPTPQMRPLHDWHGMEPVSTDSTVTVVPQEVLPANARASRGPPVYVTTLPPIVPGLRPAVAQLGGERVLIEATQASLTGFNSIGV